MNGIIQISFYYDFVREMYVDSQEHDYNRYNICTLQIKSRQKKDDYSSLDSFINSYNANWKVS